MTCVTVTGIGPAERRVVELILDDIVVADRITVDNVKRLRRQFDLRSLRLEIEDLAIMEKKRLIDGGADPLLFVAGAAATLTWGALKEAGYSQPEAGGDECYGCEYSVDKVTLIWLQDKRIKREVWVWQDKPAGPDGKPTGREPSPIGLEMLDAIATLDEAMDLALREPQTPGT